jgi:hypothetical protein
MNIPQILILEQVGIFKQHLSDEGVLVLPQIAKTADISHKHSSKD